MASSELEQLLAKLEPDAHALLAALCDALDERDILAIAGAEGLWHSEHLAALRLLIADRRSPPDLFWQPREVCELTRWSRPAIYHPGQTTHLTDHSIRNHRQRAFCCAVLLSSDAQPGHQLDNTDAAVLVGSAIILGPHIIQLARRCLAGCSLAPEVGPSEFPFFLLGVLICSLAEPLSTLRPEALARLTQHIETAESTARETGIVDTDEWLLGLSHYNQRHDLWRSLVQHFLVEPQRPHPPEADAALRRLGRMILDGVKS